MMAIYHKSLIFLIAAALFGPAGLLVSQANALQGVQAPPARRIEHVDMNARMLRKRAPAPRPTVPLVQRQAPTGTATQPTPTPSNTATNGQGNNPPGNGDANTTTCSNIIDCLLGGNGNGNSVTTTTAPTSTPSSTSTTSQSSSSSTTSQSRTSQTSNRSTNTRTTVVTATDAPAQQSDKSADPESSFLPKPVIIGLIVTASCVVGGAAIWTVIRKWKFSPSRHFEDRLEPINWEPTQPSGLPHDPTVAALARGVGSSGSHRGNGSIGSSDDQHTRNQMAMAPDYPPAHDFTAGTAPNGGYVDMHRGVSPAPPAPANYGGRYETPNPYDAYDYNAGYGQRHY